MSECSRCSIARLMQRAGADNIIEIQYPPDNDPLTWPKYEIYRKITNPEKDGYDLSEEVIRVGDALYVWCMTVFSLKHSLDEDCMVGNRSTRHAKGEQKATIGHPRIVPKESVTLVNKGTSTNRMY